MNTNGHKRAVLYARVSGDDRHTEGRNLDGQIAMGRKYAEEHGYTVVAELPEDDKGASGAAFELPQLNKIREMAAAGEFDVLIARELDRLSRSLAKQLIVEEELRRGGVTIEYVLGDYADTPEGGLMKNVRAVVAEYERLKIAERLNRGRHLKAQTGQWPGHTPAAYGYAKAGEGRNVHLVIDERQAEIVRRIFRWYIADMMPIRQIVRRLNSEGVPPPLPPHRPSRGWWRAMVLTILKRRQYLGEFTYAGHPVPMPHLRIIDDATFEAAQRQIEENKRTAKRHRKHEYLLSGHLRCSCALAMSGATGTSGHTVTSPRKYYRYYRCVVALGHYLAKCRQGVIAANAVEAGVWDWLVEHLDEEVLAEGLREQAEHAAAAQAPMRQRLAIVNSLIEKADRKTRRLAAALGDEEDDVTAEALRAEMKTASRERAALTAEGNRITAELDGDEQTIDALAILNTARQLRLLLTTAPDRITYDDKRAMLRALKVTVALQGNKAEGRRLAITCIIPAWNAVIEYASISI
jgi:site-specific DNA recombinase